MANHVGFIGLGAMGRHISANLTKIGRVSVWNRTSSVAAQHAQDNNTIHFEHLSQFSNTRFICLCLPTSDVSKSICEELIPHLTQPNTIILDHTSGNPLETVALAQYVQELSNGNVSYIDAPISGGPAGAQAATLTAMVGATDPQNDGAQLSIVLKAMAERIVYLDVVGAGNAVKAINNMMNVSHLVFASECMYGLKLAGVNVSSALDAINHSSGRSLQTQVRLPTEVLTGQYKYGFDLALMLKDVRQARAFLTEQFSKQETTEDRIPTQDLLLTEWGSSLERLLQESLESDLEKVKHGDVGVVLNDFGVPDYTRCVSRYDLVER
jgi:3-hydroxyisobutyrate dehydrogenase